MATTLDEVRQELGMAEARVIDARRSMDSIEATLRVLIETVPVAYPLPAPALTEQAIVDALKAEPAMAGAVIAELVKKWTPGDRHAAARSAAGRVTLSTQSGAYSLALQSLAVALAAASYRG